MSKIIGLTGGIGSGKSVVAKYIASKGIPVYIADDEAKKISEDKNVIKEIQQLFEETIILNNGKLDRDKLRSLVFNNKEKIIQLNSIIHPKVKLHFDKWLIQYKNMPFVFKEVAILFETNGHLKCDEVVLVTAPKETRIKRVMQRDSCSRISVLKIIKNQMTEKEKEKLSNYVIINKNLKRTLYLTDIIINNLKIKYNLT